jgi:hypothetical protein
VQAKVRQAMVEEAREKGEELTQDAIDEAVGYLCDELTDEMLITAIEMGSELIIPGIGIAIRVARGAWKASSSRVESSTADYQGHHQGSFQLEQEEACCALS